MRRIAQKVGRTVSTISRELSRNSNKVGYNPKTAERRYLSRRCKKSKLDLDEDLKAYVLNGLYEGHSPEMIALRLKRFGGLEGIAPISHESIYRWLYRPPQKREKLYKLLVHHHGKRGRRKRVHRGGIKDRISIHKRPEHVMNRQQIGHWEGDLMSFRGNRQHMLVLHERKTRYTAAIRLKTKTAQETITAMITFFKALPKTLFRSITFDNGTEFAKHRKITDQLRVPTYFCDVYASWQKGGIENQNGRFRRDLPRKTNLLALNDLDFEQIVISHNLMPRKVLGGLSPIEALAKHQGKSIIFLFNKGVALHR
jgi:IS30 family transposase